MHSEISKLAGGTKLFWVVSVVLIAKDLTEVGEWIKRWQMSFTVDYSKVNYVEKSNQNDVSMMLSFELAMAV